MELAVRLVEETSLHIFAPINLRLVVGNTDWRLFIVEGDDRGILRARVVLIARLYIVRD